ncbi:prolyl oligopeptidase family serine peptidase [Streptomyces sp. NPDC005963]|uniref:prolyl oligopeptidase family serine peptidase n=1 Tax=Streptomyces sp. NPDC005963 TaxID=3156721 RepID=UPI0033D02D81
MSVTPPPYPPARIVEVHEDVAGVRVPDPYRWLEPETDEVRQWQRRQAELATAVSYDGQDRAAVRKLIETYDRGSRPALPRYAAGRWFRAETLPGGAAPTVVVADLPFGEGRPVVDPAVFGSERNPAFLSWLVPAPNGRVLALGVCTDGSEHNTIRLVEVDTGRVLDGAPPQVLHSAWAGGVSWLPDSSGFCFLALTGSPKEFRQAVFHHRLAVPSPGGSGTGNTAVEPIPVGEGSREYTLVQFSSDGRWAVASHRVGSPVPIAVRDLSRPGTSWRPFVTDCAGTIAGHVVGDHYIAVTDVDAPRGRVVALPLDAADPNDPSTWTELVPEGKTVLRSLSPVGEHLYLSEFDETFARVRILDRSGAVTGKVPLPGRGALAAPFFAMTGLAVGAAPDDFVFAFSTLTSSWGVYRHRPGETGIETLSAPAVTLDAEVVVGRAIASDGVAVPYHVVRSAGGDPTRPAPTLISAYGAANVPLLPQYQPDLAAFVAAGGVLVQAYLRGGGEFGRDWYLAAHRERKHVRDTDLVAVAEHLLDTGLTSTDRLALTGGSDGGLMCGVALTTRPELWCAVLPRAPLLDLIGALRDPYLDFVIRKAWADPDDPEQRRRLLGLSPYQLVRPGAFPAVYLQAGATDPRCPPWQARKFAARLQTAQEGPAPILLHVYDNAGHGAATSHEIAVEQDAEWLAFLIRTLGLDTRSGHTAGARSPRAVSAVRTGGFPGSVSRSGRTSGPSDAAGASPTDGRSGR